MEGQESFREIENLRFRFQMNNRLRLECLAAVSKVFREFGEPIADDVLAGIVFALPKELVSNNGNGNGHSQQAADLSVDSQTWQAGAPPDAPPKPGAPPDVPPKPGAPPDAPPKPGAPPDAPPKPGAPPDAPPKPGAPPDAPPKPGAPPDVPPKKY